MNTARRNSRPAVLAATFGSIGALAPLLLAGPAVAAKPPKPPTPNGAPALSIDAAPTNVVFGASTVLSGKLSGAKAPGVVVRIEQDTTAPFGDAFVPTARTTTTAANGTWSVSVRPTVNALYHAVAMASPTVTSPVKRVNVRPAVRLSVSDSTPARGALVRFSGAVAPAHDGRSALIQRRGTDGVFRTVARAQLRDAGTSRSTYSRRLRVRSTGVYRTKIAQHADHTNGYSALRTLTVRTP
ncbi:hypothetical protein [Patulibacter americanus]|uniref:hypothetical protein n=1 Tax=Patulibacter americanus TaxID=588672 RepID=UPI0003B65B93|nr:hypothetical protein [Patulibacter americanus]